MYSQKAVKNADACRLLDVQTSVSGAVSNRKRGKYSTCKGTLGFYGEAWTGEDG